MPLPLYLLTRLMPLPQRDLMPQTGADREVQRILLELLNQMDGFDVTVNVKVLSTPLLN